MHASAVPSPWPDSRAPGGGSYAPRVSLCRLLKDRNEPQNTSRTEARQMLAEVYGWFSEGFDMPDLQEARALLAEDS